MHGLNFIDLVSTIILFYLFTNYFILFIYLIFEIQICGFVSSVFFLVLISFYWCMCAGLNKYFVSHSCV